MKLFQKPIFTGFMPNLHAHEVGIAFSFFLPWNWGKIRKGNFTKQAEQKLEEFFSVSSATTFDSGRSALYFSLKALDIQPGDEVLVQAYTCGVVSNAIIWTGATPVYVDVKNDFTLDPNDLKKKITSRSKVLILQHTFGIPADIDSLMQIAKDHNLKIIEDCAHTIGGMYKGKLLGTFGHIGMLSFGSDKAISCGRGGALITQDPVIAQKIDSLQQSLSTPPFGIVIKQLFTYLIFFVTKPFYNLGIGKFILALGKRLHFITRIIEPEEKHGKNLPFYPSLLANSLSKILLFQIEKIHSLNAARLKWGKAYIQALPKNILPQIPNAEIFFLRFPLLVSNPKKLHNMAKQQGILFGDWYNAPIAPKDMRIEYMQYQLGSCPNAEKLAIQSVNLPTHYKLTQTDFERIQKIIEKYARS